MKKDLYLNWLQSFKSKKTLLRDLQNVQDQHCTKTRIKKKAV